MRLFFIFIAFGVLRGPKEAPLEPCPWQTTSEELRRSATALEAELVACRPHVELPPWPAEGDEELWRQLSALRRQVKSLRAGEKTEALEERLAAFKVGERVDRLGPIGSWGPRAYRAYSV